MFGIGDVVYPIGFGFSELPKKSSTSFAEVELVFTNSFTLLRLNHPHGFNRTGIFYLQQITARF